MDNLARHKGAGIGEDIEAVGAEVRYLPPYSPDLNPIELAFAKFKKLLRDGCLLYTSDPADQRSSVHLGVRRLVYRNYFKHCGYRSP